MCERGSVVRLFLRSEAHGAVGLFFLSIAMKGNEGLQRFVDDYDADDALKSSAIRSDPPHGGRSSHLDVWLPQYKEENQ